MFLTKRTCSGRAQVGLRPRGAREPLVSSQHMDSMEHSKNATLCALWAGIEVVRLGDKIEKSGVGTAGSDPETQLARI